MQQEELFHDIEDSLSITEKYLGLSIGKFLFLFSIVLFMGIYIGILLYGTNSVEVLLKLEDYETFLQDETTRLKNENAMLQKEYFELKEISAK